jgi:uroporphyrinogen-III decarboxylase
MIRGLVQGSTPTRPLFLPIVFAHAARIENMPLRTFLTNPTKISNSLRQLRARLRSDGITGYFDPLLEAEALGGVVEWDAEGQTASLSWPEHMIEQAASKASSPSVEPATGGRVPVALDVIRRLKTTLRADCLLMASVTGPLTLAASLAQLDATAATDMRDVPEPALDLAAGMISGIAKAFVDAGATVVLIREDFLPALSEEEFSGWRSRLAPTVNIVRFYEALPVLLLNSQAGVMANRDAILRELWDCVVCSVFDGRPESVLLPELGSTRFGVALAPEAVAAGGSGAAEFDELVRAMVSFTRPAVITTAGDLPAAMDMERLNRLWDNIRR